MGRSRKQPWKSGDCFLIPLKDGTFLIGQVLSAEPEALNSVGCALFDQRSDGQTLVQPRLANLFSLLLTTRDLLDAGEWKILATFPVEVPRKRFPFEALRSSGFVGAKIIGSGIVAEFANAFCGLVPWDDWADPNYLDQFLLGPELKPKTLKFKG